MQGADEDGAMGGRAKARTVATKCVAATVAEASSSRADRHAVEAPSAPLLALAEELGRLLARRLLTDQGRRGYSLPELLFGAVVVAIVWVLIARTLGLLVH